MKIFFLSVLLSSSFLSFSQNYTAAGEFKVALISTKNGAIMVFSGKKHSFTLDIHGDSIQSTDQSNWVLIDKMIVQASCIPIPGGRDASKFTSDKQREALNGNVDYEMDYFQNELKLVTKDLKKNG